jgi:16S rRNA processing protein RimM
MISIGRLTKTHGLQGELVFLPYIDDFALLPDLTDQPVSLRHQTKTEQVCRVVSWRYSHKRLLLIFDGYQTRERADQLRDYEICIARQRFSPLPDGEYYWFDIEGLRVYDCNAQLLGTITEIIHTGSNDVYVVKDHKREFLIPALRSVVRNIDIANGALHLFPVLDLLD